MSTVDKEKIKVLEKNGRMIEGSIIRCILYVQMIVSFLHLPEWTKNYDKDAHVVSTPAYPNGLVA